MKCPLFVIRDRRVQLGEETEYGDCLKEECAWWLQDVSMCAMKDIALELLHTQLRLADIIDKSKREGGK